MKIDRVVFCLNAHPEYRPLWELNAKLYSEVFKIRPTLFFVGDQHEFEAAELSEAYGEVFRLERHVPGLPPRSGHRDAVTTLALLHGPHLFPDEVVMTSGIDQFPLSARFFDLVSELEQDLVIGFAGCRDYTHHPRNYGIP